jgi:hypothetical protein
MQHASIWLPDLPPSLAERMQKLLPSLAPKERYLARSKLPRARTRGDSRYSPPIFSPPPSLLTSPHMRFGS